MNGTDRWHPRHLIGPASVAAIVLLLSFHQVVAGVVRHAHEAPAATQEHHLTQAACAGIADEAARSLCRSRLDAQWVADATPLH